MKALEGNGRLGISHLNLMCDSKLSALTTRKQSGSPVTLQSVVFSLFWELCKALKKQFPTEANVNVVHLHFSFSSECTLSTLVIPTLGNFSSQNSQQWPCRLHSHSWKLPKCENVGLNI